MKRLGRIGNWLRGLLRRDPAVETAPAVPDIPLRQRERVDHVVLLDGTMGSLLPGQETNIGSIFKLLRDQRNARLSVYYDPGVQWRAWRQLADVATGHGINDQIRAAYGWLATRYHPGDRIWLMGYSRGAFAARSLAGVIDRVGLLRADQATERNVQLAWRYYQSAEVRPARDAFVRRFCLPRAEVGIEMIGVFDTVKALGIRLPFLWVWTEPQHDFHSHAMGTVVRNGFHAIALDERRVAFHPILWDTRGADLRQRVEQVWFRGVHGDVGGQLGGDQRSRPLANIPLVWMLERAQSVGLPLPQDWKRRFPMDPSARSVGMNRSWGKLFILRGQRPIGVDPSERLHPSAVIAATGQRPAIPVLAEMFTEMLGDAKGDAALSHPAVHATFSSAASGTNPNA
jgi:uncharacterized protein (DUF2235 family)